MLQEILEKIKNGWNFEKSPNGDSWVWRNKDWSLTGDIEFNGRKMTLNVGINPDVLMDIDTNKLPKGASTGAPGNDQGSIRITTSNINDINKVLALVEIPEFSEKNKS